MKRRYTSMILAAMVGAMMLGGCGTGTTKSTETSYAGETIYGQVSEVSEDTIKLELGTMSDSSGSQTSDSEGTEKDSAQQMPGGNTELELTGEETTITVDDDTEITKQSAGGPGGSAPSGEAPSKPDGEASTGEVPSAPDSEAPTGETSSATDGDTSTGDTQAQTPPEKPDGESASDDQNQNSTQEPPEKPDGENGTDNQNGNTEDISIEDISEGDTVSVTFADDGTVEEIVVLSGNAGGGPGGSSNGVESYDAVEDITEDTEKSAETVNSTGTDENAIHVYEGAKAVLDNATIDRTSSDSTGGDNSSFYGVGAALLTTDGTTYLSDSTITTDAAGAAGVFAYGDSTTYVADTKITTQQDTSGGIHAAGGGTLYAWNLDVETSGQSSAAIRSDRGGGTMVVDGGSYTSNGTGSPAIYSTADIAVNDAELTANGSEAICIEGLNSIHLFDSDLTGNMSDDEQNDCTWNVILYQSMSGDSEVGNSTFEMDGGSLTAKNGGMFYTTNTESTITLSDVDITYADENDFFLRCTGNNNQRGWGTSGQNGADCLFTAVNQKMEGDVIWDSISQLDFYMTEGSTLTGAVTDDETFAGEGGDGYCNLYLDKNSTWIVTGDSTLTSLSNAGTIKDAEGNTVTIKGTDGTVYVQGTSQYTVTVGSYDTKGDVSGASTVSSWSDYEVAEPEEPK